ncbi:uncharacterized protein LOC133178089 [Saccostrea echinata]|uniref:uncharacterized protein LOC133178089 n=1 Tax=Saccostrea echinata TaxID=191078 RepID=UPI002A818E65|nr:uncharacterized protein LOC133178089 [Saccostrea echinata]
MFRAVDEYHWHRLAEHEASENQKREHQHGRGVCTVFLLDTSASMAGEGFHQMKRAFMDISNEFIVHPHLDENVAVIMFGEDVKFLHYYSNNYGSIRNCLGHIECRGSSPLEAGILLSLSCLRYGGGHNAVFNPHIKVRARLVIISDGRPTTSGDIGGPELDNASKESIFDGGFLKSLVELSTAGRLIFYENAKQCGRFALNMRIACCIVERKMSSNLTRDEIKTIAKMSSLHDVSGKDLEDVCDIINEIDAYKPITAEDLEEDVFTERYENLPGIGTRVKRGPHWTWKNQDSHGPGTVIGHSERVGWVNVEWDSGVTLSYQYGFDGFIEKYDITPCKEPRILENEMIAVGCLVTRGPDWKWGDQDGGEGNVGTVYRVRKEAVILVKWPNGNRSNYRYGYDNKYDVTVCDPFDPLVLRSLNFQHRSNDSGNPEKEEQKK